MEDSLRGVLVTLTLISIFIMAILGFIFVFPQSQGETFSTGKDNTSYLVVQSVMNDTASGQLNNISNQTTNAFNNWDVTQGFMGSGTMKQTSGTGILSYFSLVTTTLTTMANQIFGANSPIIIVMAILTSLGIAYLIWLAYKFVRTGS